MGEESVSETKKIRGGGENPGELTKYFFYRNFAYPFFVVVVVARFDDSF